MAEICPGREDNGAALGGDVNNTRLGFARRTDRPIHSDRSVMSFAQISYETEYAARALTRPGIE